MGDTVGMGFVPGFLFKLPFFTKTGRLLLKVIWIGMIFVLAILSLLLFRSRLAAAADYASIHPGKSLLFGLIWMAAFLPLFILLLITVIGIPIAILLLVAFPIACFFGYCAAGIVLGRKVTGMGLGTAGIASMLLGLLLLESLGILGKTLDTLGGSFWLVGMFLSVVGWAVALTAVSVGLGAITAIRFRPYLTPPVPAMAGGMPGGMSTGGFPGGGMSGGGAPAGGVPGGGPGGSPGGTPWSAPGGPMPGTAMSGGETPGGGFTSPGAETGGTGSAPYAPPASSPFASPGSPPHAPPASSPPSPPPYTPPPEPPPTER
jgi:hypothetical protein